MLSVCFVSIDKFQRLIGKNKNKFNFTIKKSPTMQ